MLSDSKLQQIKDGYPIGTKIKLLKDMDDPYPVLAGSIGVVKEIDSEGSLHMSWENGGSLALIIGVDEFEIIEKPEKIKVVIVEPEKNPYSKEIYNTLEAKQEIVGGLIQCVPSYFSNDISYDFIMNDEGKLMGLPLNRFIWDKQDLVAGNLIIAKADEETGEFVSLTEDEVSFIKERIEKDCPKVTPMDLYNILHDDQEHDEVEM